MGRKSSASEIKVKYTIVNSEFNKAIKAMEGEIKNLDKAFKLQKEEMKLTATESEKLSAALEHLKQKQALAKEKVEQTKKALDNAKKTFGENSKEAQNWSNKLIDAKKNEAYLANQISETNKKLEQAKNAESEAAKASQKRREKLQELAHEQDKLKTSSEKLKKQYELNKRELGKNASETEKLKLKQEYLKKSMQNSKDAVKNLESQLELAKKEYGENSQEVEKLKNKLIDAKIVVHDLSDEYKKTSKELEKASDKMGKTADKITKVSDKINKTGSALTKKVTAPILAVGAGAMKAFTEVDEGLDIVIQKTGATGNAAKGLEKSFKNVYSNFPASSSEVGNAIGEINTQFGFLGKELEEKTTLMLKFSKINGQDVTQSTIQSKQAIEAFNLSGKDLDLVLDSVTKTAQNTGVSTDKLFDSVVKGAPALQGMGLNFSQSVALMGQFEQSGVDSTKAMSYLTKAQANWAKEGKSMQDGLSELTNKIKGAKNEQEAIALATEVFGTKAGPMMAKAIKDGKLNFDELAGSASSAKDSVKSTFEGTKDPIDDFTTAMNNLKIVGAELGKVLQETLAPIIKKLTEKLREFTEWFKKLTPQQQEFIVETALIAATLGPVLKILGVLGKGLGKVAGGLSTVGNAWGVAFKGAEATTTSVKVLAKVMSGFSKIGGPLLGIFKGVFTSIGGLFLKLLPLVMGVFQSIGAFLLANPLALVLVAVVAALAFIWYKWGDDIKAFFKKHWEELKESFTQGWKNITEGLSNLWKGFIEGAKAIWDGLKNIFSFLWLGIKEIFNIGWLAISAPIRLAWEVFIGIAKAIWEPLAKFFSDMFTGIGDTAKGVWQSILDFTVLVWRPIADFLKDTWSAISDFANSVFNGIKDTISSVFNFIDNSIIKPIWNSVSDFLSSIWNGISTNASQTYEGIKNFLGSTWDNIKSKTVSSWSNIKSNLGQHWDNIKTNASNKFRDIKNSISSVWDAVKRNTSSKWGAIKDVVSSKIASMGSLVKSGLDSISRFFSNCRLSLPNIKLPHFSIDGEFSLDPPSIPHISVDWYKTGAIAKRASIVGIGEAGNEAVVPLQGRYMYPFAKAIADRINMMNSRSSAIINIQINQDIKENVDYKKGVEIIDKELEKRGYRLNYGTGGI